MFRLAVRLMPEAVETVVRRIHRKVGDLDLVIAHQANGRILEAVGRRLEIDPGKMPVDLDRYGNTAAAIPLLFHESRRQGLVPPGSLVAFTAFGAGAHWAAIAYQQP